MRFLLCLFLAPILHAQRGQRRAAGRVLVRLRELPEFASVRRRVRARAEAIWTF